MATPNDPRSTLDPSPRGNQIPRSPSFGEQTSRVKEDVRELGHIAMTSAGEAIHTVKERGNEVLETARERGEELFQLGRERMKSGSQSLERFVAENPLKAVLIAIALGAWFGRMRR